VASLVTRRQLPSPVAEPHLASTHAEPGLPDSDAEAGPDSDAEAGPDGDAEAGPDCCAERADARAQSRLLTARNGHSGGCA
jgi:hypothetical protein